jgi:hypothetical protein
MALSKEEQEQLDALTAKANEPDPQEDFEMEIYDGPKGARVPYSKGRSWLQTHFGIDLDPSPATEAGNDDGKNSATQNKSGKGKAEGKQGEADPDPAGRSGHWSRRIDGHKTA